VAGVICTVVGTGRSQFDGDGKLALATSLYLPLDVCFDSSGRPLILDWNNFRIRRVNAGGTVETVMGTGFEDEPVEGAPAPSTPLHHASDLETDAEGNLYVAGNHASFVFRVGVDQLVEIVAGSGEYGYDGDGGPGRSAALGAPYGVAVSPDGGFYFSDVEQHVVRYVNAEGIISTVLGDGVAGYTGDGGPGRSARIHGPTRLRLDEDGNLYVCDTDNHVVRRLDGGGVVMTIAGTGQPGYDGDGSPATAARLNAPHDLRFSSDGDLYVADSGNNVIRKVDGSTIITTVIGTGVAGFDGDGADARNCRLDRPSSVIFDVEGSLWISDTYNQRVRRVTHFLRDGDANTR
jgi:sugar lactone lactonase YvrE